MIVFGCFAFIEMIADEILNVPAKLLAYFENSSFGFVKANEFGGISWVDIVFQFVAFHQLMPAHEIKVYLILFPFAKHKLSKCLNLRQILDALVH